MEQDLDLTQVLGPSPVSHSLPIHLPSQNVSHPPPPHPHPAHTTLVFVETSQHQSLVNGKMGPHQHGEAGTISSTSLPVTQGIVCDTPGLV